MRCVDTLRRETHERRTVLREELVRLDALLASLDICEGGMRANGVVCRQGAHCEACPLDLEWRPERDSNPRPLA